MNRDSLRDSISSLESKKEALEHELQNIHAQLHVQKAQYARIVNNDDAPIHKLLPEILADIFITFQRSFSMSNKRIQRRLAAPLTLSNVCHSWREIVMSTSLLWNIIDLRFPSRSLLDLDLRRFQFLLNMHLTRSGTCFLDITLNFSIHDNISSLLSLLANDSHRWRRFAVFSRNQLVCEQVQAFLRDADSPTLEYLSLTIGQPEDEGPRRPYANVYPSVLFSVSQALKFVRLAGLALGNHHPPTSSVTTLHLDGWTRNYMTHKQFRHILQSATSLINLSLNQLFIHHPRDPSEILQPVNLPRLLSLRLRGPSSPISRALCLIKMPQLQSLSLENLDSFDSGILSSVQSLSIESCPFDDTEIIHLFQALPSITSLSIDQSLAPHIYSMLLPGETLPEPWLRLHTVSLRELSPIDVSHFCNLVFTLEACQRGLRRVFLDRRSRTVLRSKHRLDWLRERLQVENCDHQEPWPLGLGYDDPHDLLAE